MPFPLTIGKGGPQQSTHMTVDLGEMAVIILPLQNQSFVISPSGNLISLPLKQMVAASAPLPMQLMLVDALDRFV